MFNSIRSYAVERINFNCVTPIYVKKCRVWYHLIYQIKTLSDEPDAIEFVNEAFHHCKATAAHRNREREKARKVPA